MITNTISKIRQRYVKSELRKVFSEPFGIIGFLLILFILLIAIFAPLLAPYDPDSVDIVNRLSGPTIQHLLGTDNLGRDILSRIIYGSRVVLIVSVLTISFGIVLAIVFGIIAGISSDRIGDLFIIVFDIIRSFPPLLFAMTVIALTGPSLPTLIVIIGVTRFPAYARLIRGQTLRVKKKEYIKAARAIGSPLPVIMFKHILPNVIGPVFIQAAMDIPVVISIEAALSFLGLGIQPPTPSWGGLLKGGYLYIRTSPWMVIFGGIALIFATLGFTLFGEALRDKLDPKLR